MRVLVFGLFAIGVGVAYAVVFGATLGHVPMPGASLGTLALLEMHPLTAARLLSPVIVTGVVSIIAFVTRRRAVFVCGVLGCWLAGALFPEPRIYEQNHRPDLGELAARDARAAITRGWGLSFTGGMLGSAVGLIGSEAIRRRRTATAGVTKIDGSPDPLAESR